MHTLSPQQAFEQAVRDRLAGRLNEAISLCLQAAEHRPDIPEIHNLLGDILLDQQKYEQASAAYDRAIALRPGYTEAHFSRGRACMGVGRWDDAVASTRRALELRPGIPEALNNLGLALGRIGREDESIAAFRQALAQRPDYAPAHYNLGIALFVKGQFNPAIVEFQAAIASQPNHFRAHNNLGIALQRVGQRELAAAAYRRSAALAPTFAEVHYNLATVLHEMGRLPAALAACQLALGNRPDYAEANDLLGTLLRSEGKIDEAIATYRLGVAQLPQAPSIRWNLSLMLLLQGDFPQGWRDYEARLKVQGFPVKMDFPRPMWDGSNLEGRRILLHVEQGLGDAIQFIRYAPMVADRGAHVIVQCPSPVLRLFTGQPGISEVISDKDPLPPFDVHCPLMSLPGIFQTTMATIPANTPYLNPEPALKAFWRDKLNQLPAGMKVGLAWAGNPTNLNDRNRSIHLQTLAPLAKAKGVTFVSLQKGDSAAQAKTPPPGMNLIDWPDAQENFAQTAALMSNLDLIISVDTAVAHLASALGKPTWVLLPFSADWRWLLDRDDSPWYPGMRLFRQKVPGEWAEPVRQLAEVLAATAKKSETGAIITS